MSVYRTQSYYIQTLQVVLNLTTGYIVVEFVKTCQSHIRYLSTASFLKPHVDHLGFNVINLV